MRDAIRILHIADSHIGADLPRHRRHGRPRRGDDFVDSHRRAVLLGIELGVDLAIHAGDLFDSPRPSANAIAAAATPLREIADAGIPVIIVPGNHERAAVSEALPLDHPNIHVIASSRTIEFKVRGIRAAVSGFPCIRRGAASQFAVALSATGWNDVAADVRILALHQAFDSAVCGPNGYRFRAGEDVIERAAIPCEFDYVACGHIHRYQKLRAAARLRPHIVYAGSPDRISFAEKDEPKGAVLAEVGLSCVAHRLIEHAVRPMSIHPLAVNELAKVRIVEAIEEIVCGLPADAVAQIRLTGAATPDLLKGLRIAENAYRWRPDAIVSVTVRGVEEATTSADVPCELQSGAGADVRNVFADAEAKRVYSVRVGNLSALPARRGVYAFIDSMNRVLYIGKAANLRSRVRSHLSERSGGNFFDGWVAQAARIDAVLSTDDASASALEMALIGRWRPPFNIAGRLTAG
ncbi:MAG: metallophosphoesterase [Phycisphaerales bacterium]|nr:metallophosphoesterase [Phycisphaerales bacterium]MCB9862366.1 metallophosphoesterase [Phycisphaerales bacterium]